MPGFAVAAGSPLASTPDVALGAPAPEPFWDSLGAAVGPNFTDAARSAEGRHQEDYRASLWERHRQAEKLAGTKLPLSESLTGEASDTRDPVKRALDALLPVDRLNAAMLGRPGVMSDDDYEAHLAELKAKTPALASIETREQILSALQARWNAERGAATASADKGAGGAVGAFLGQTAGVMSDPRQAVLAFATGGAGASRGLAGRLLMQGAVNAGQEALFAPGKVEEARRLGGPEYTVGQAATDVAAAGVGGIAFEGAFSLGRVGLRALRGAPLEPAERVAAEVLDRGWRDDAAIGPAPGADHQAALDSLDAGGPPPRFEPDRDLADLFSPEAGGGVDVAMYKGRPIFAQSFDPGALATDAARFQYKADADAEGVTARLRGVEAWDPLAAGRVLVWEDRAGAQFVADGHQRFGLIRRLNDDRGFDHALDGYLFREADGWSAADLRVVAALKNIREGSGSPMDAAKVFRDAPDALNDRSLPVTGDFMANARGLASLSDEAFRAAVNRVIDERYAAEIGRGAPARPDLHMDMLRLMKAAEPANVDEARALVVEALQDDWIKAEGSQEDLFGYDPSQSAMIGRAKVAAAVKRALGRDARLFGQLVKNADAIEAGGNALARDANQARLAVDRAALEVASKLALRHGPIGEAMADAAAKVTKGENPATAARPVLARLREALEAGERLDNLRGVTLDPKPPTPHGEAQAARFDDPNGEGAKAQAVSAPEDLAFETGDMRAAMAAEIDRVLKAAGEPGATKGRAKLGEVSPWLADEAAKAGLKLDGYAYVMDVSAVRHTLKNHGDAKTEAARGQVAVTEADLRALPDLFAEPDHAAFGATDKQGKPLVFLSKGQPDGSTLVLAQARTGKQHLALWSMWKVPGAIDGARLGKLADPNARSDAGAIKIVSRPRDASAVAEVPPPGLFDDLPETGTAAKAREALIQCVPGEGE